MTDEEKAEEYAIEITDELRDKGVLTNEEINQRYAGIVQGVLYGLAEGRKEATEENFKEAYQKYVNNSLATFDMKKALEDARDQIRLVKENEKLKAQIERMKNVGNCKKAMTCAEWNEKQTMLGCMKFCKDCKEWELAE